MMYEEAKLARKMVDRFHAADRLRGMINEDIERYLKIEIEIGELEQKCLALGGQPVKYYLNKATEISTALMRGNNLIVL